MIYVHIIRRYIDTSIDTYLRSLGVSRSISEHRSIGATEPLPAHLIFGETSVLTELFRDLAAFRDCTYLVSRYA